MDACRGCGFIYGATPRWEIPSRLRISGGEFTIRLAAPPEQLRGHRAPGEWSPLEYSCHVRDLLLVQRDRLYVAMVEDEPSFTSMYRNERVALDRYDAQVPHVVAQQIVMAADLLSHSFDGVTDSQWARPLMYGFPHAQRRDVEWLAHHTLHELAHHLEDVDRILGEGDVEDT